ncbi:MAG: HAD family phosphatase [Micrococcales bacterium]|nr:HAD family phosphatase [Micrococcales bacterium]
MQPTNHLTAVLFDFGQVLVAWEPFRAYEADYSREEFDAFLARTEFFGEFNTKQDAGRSFAEARLEFAETHPEDLAFFDRYLSHYEHTIVGPVPGTEEIVAELQAAGIKAYGLTNWPEELFPVALARIPAIQRLDGYVVSGVVKVAKPDREVFDIAIDTLQLDPPTTLFVDDHHPNIEAADALGFQTHLFTTLAHLRDDLESRRVLQQ